MLENKLPHIMFTYGYDKNGQQILLKVSIKMILLATNQCCMVKNFGEKTAAKD